MSTLETTVDSAEATADDTVPTVGGTTASPSLVGVLTSSDHKVIGRMLIGFAIVGLLVVGALGALLGAERIDGDGTLLRESALTQLFAGYRVGLVEAALLP
ncbi:MAG: hypothetical protein M3431_10305, partial [Actinomycetota bacterium]|nr:hypothetical protein [Actinomycetota bacterium]